MRFIHPTPANWRNRHLKPRTAFRGFPPVLRAERQGQQWVDLTRSPNHPAMTGNCAIAPFAHDCWIFHFGPTPPVRGSAVVSPGAKPPQGAPERAADFRASVATAIHHRAHRPSAQRALTSFHRPATTRRFTVAQRPVPFGALSAFPCETEMRTKGLVRSSLRWSPCRLLAEFGPPAESSVALCAGRQPIRPVSSWRLARRQTRPSRRRLQQPRA